MSSNAEALSVNMRSAIGLLEFFLVAIVVALGITIVSVPAGVQVLAGAVVSPIIVLSVVFIHYCRRRKIWSYAGASVLGAIGVLLRVVISTQPTLEVGGGLPIGVTVFYIVLGALVSLKSYECVLELRSSPEKKSH